MHSFSRFNVIYIMFTCRNVLRHWQCRKRCIFSALTPHYNDVIMGAIASQITSLTIVYTIIYSDADQRKHQSSASLVTGEFPAQMASYAEMLPFDDVIIFGRKETKEDHQRSHIDRLLQERRNSNALAMKLLLSCTNLTRKMFPFDNVIMLRCGAAIWKAFYDSCCCSYVKNNDQIISQFCTRHDNWAILGSAILVPTWVVRIRDSVGCFDR